MRYWAGTYRVTKKPILYRIHNNYLEPDELDPIEEVDRAIPAIQGEDESE